MRYKFILQLCLLVFLIIALGSIYLVSSATFVQMMIIAIPSILKILSEMNQTFNKQEDDEQ